MFYHSDVTAWQAGGRYCWKKSSARSVGESGNGVNVKQTPNRYVDSVLLAVACLRLGRFMKSKKAWCLDHQEREVDH
jgi:hypothetical protein